MGPLVIDEPFDQLEDRRDHCLVTGASGFLGGHLVDALIARGDQVRCLLRRTSTRGFLSDPSIDFAFGDIQRPETLTEALDGIDTVYHVAGLIRAYRPEDFYRVNYLGTINLLEACRRRARQIRRVIIVSSLAAVGSSASGNPVDEQTECHPSTPYGKSKLLGEVATAAYRTDLPITIIRPPTIYGPRDRETLLLFKVVAAGLAPRFASHAQISVIHVADLVRGILLASDSAWAIDRTYFLANDDSYSLNNLVDAIAKAIGRRQIRIPIPATAIRAAGRVSEGLGALRKQAVVFDRHKANEILLGGWACQNDRARNELGFRQRISLANGLSQTVDWYRTVGWL